MVTVLPDTTDDTTMARRGRSQTTQRDITNSIATPSAVSPYQNLYQRELRATEQLYRHLRELEDRRQWHPQPKHLRTPAVTRSGAARLQLSKRPTSTRTANQLSQRVAFASPKHVLVCLRRKIRREIFFALKLKGRGGSRKRNPWSNYSCRG